MSLTPSQTSNPLRVLEVALHDGFAGYWVASESIRGLAYKVQIWFHTGNVTCTCWDWRARRKGGNVLDGRGCKHVRAVLRHVESVIGSTLDDRQRRELTAIRRYDEEYQTRYWPDAQEKTL